MAELRAWVLAQLLWNPQQDDRALIREFLDGYYGPGSQWIEAYLELLENASSGYNLTCYSPVTAPYLHFDTLATAEKLWREAEAAVAGDDELLARVRVGHLAVRFVWLTQWDSLRKECAAAGAKWPLDSSRRKVAQEWRARGRGRSRQTLDARYLHQRRRTNARAISRGG